MFPRVLCTTLVLSLAIGSTARVLVAAQDVPPVRPDPAASFVIEEAATSYRFEDDGSGYRREKYVVKIVDQGGVGPWGTLGFPYMAAIESVLLRELVVEKPDGRRVEVTDRPLEDVTATGQVDEPTVSDWRAKKITVPTLQPGDRLRYEVEFKRSASLVPNQFWLDHVFTRVVTVQNETLEVDVPASRAVKVYARRGEEQRDVTASPGRKVMRWKHQQLEPLKLQSDPKVVIAFTEDRKLGPDVRVASFTGWEQLGSWFDGVVAVKVTPDATVRAKAEELTKGIESEDDKLAALFAFVSTRIRYVSLAFGSGRLEPRPASQVLSTEYGDCKDKHVLLASLAQAVGIPVRPVLISTGLPLDDRVPSPSQFDHVVSVRAHGDASRWLWMDTTTGLLPPGALLLPLRNKKALFVGTETSAAGSQKSGLVTTVERLSGANGVTIDIQGALADTGGLKTRVNRRATGDVEFLLRMALRDASAAERLEIAKGQAADDGLRDATIASEKVDDAGPGKGLSFLYEASKDYSLEYGKPWQFWLPTPSLDLEDPGDRKKVDLGDPTEVVLTARYEVPEAVKARAPLPVSIDRGFLKYSSTYRVDGRHLFIERRLVNTTREIDETQLDAYRAFRRAIDADYRQSFSIEAITGSAPANASADTLTSAGHRAIEERDYARAVEMLERATKLEPKHKLAWNNLGRAYLGLADYEKSITAYRKQIEINPYDEFAYGALGHSLRQLDRNDEAIEQLKKQIEVSPLHKYAHAELGRVYDKIGKPVEAEEWLQKAVSLSDDDANVWVDLGRSRLSGKKEKEAIEAFDRAISIRPTPDVWNNVAWALAEKGVRLDVAETHVRHAIDASVVALRTATLDNLRQAHLQVVRSIASYWDTLGWIYFKAGDPKKAEPWVRAAWSLSENGENANHVAQVSEQLGKRSEAIELYAASLATPDPHDQSRTPLEKLVGAAKVEAVIKTARDKLVPDRTVALPAILSGDATGEVHLLTVGGQIKGVRLIRGDERLRDAAQKLVGTRIPFVSPDGQEIPIVRQAGIGCSAAHGCSLVLVPPDSARAEAR
jgi:tetratricopeptide (TPR) repeat protein/transglutaminase-like putative cysteine protease